MTLPLDFRCSVITCFVLKTVPQHLPTERGQGSCGDDALLCCPLVVTGIRAEVGGPMTKKNEQKKEKAGTGDNLKEKFKEITTKKISSALLFGWHKTNLQACHFGHVYSL